MVARFWSPVLITLSGLSSTECENRKSETPKKTRLMMGNENCFVYLKVVQVGV